MAGVDDATRRATGEYTAAEWEAADLRPEHLERQAHGEYTWKEYCEGYQRTKDERKRERWALEISE